MKIIGRLTLLAADAERSKFTRMADLYAATPLTANETFQDAIAAALAIGLEPLEVARRMKIPLPTVDRWARGVSNPHSAMRPSISVVLAAMCRERAEKIAEAIDEYQRNQDKGETA